MLTEKIVGIDFYTQQKYLSKMKVKWIFSDIQKLKKLTTSRPTL
jgi:hypothetical protein